MFPPQPVDVNMEESKEEVRTGNIHTSGLEENKWREQRVLLEGWIGESMCVRVCFNVFALNGLS